MQLDSRPEPSAYHVTRFAGAGVFPAGLAGTLGARLAVLGAGLAGLVAVSSALAARKMG